ncbi:aquaporin-10-like [Dreissena polymorpha]|uniref:Aquaporin-3 n=1 Tax=Dreissena polymorpha TaxID=45954 RepID=A0A9D4KAZ0_DREPO|nr:aquaporin-10-like [Dreissena polymorpha]KAH3836223.1 hypothetical protein DPMN_109594 [Dreissena polymorpha]
MPHWSERFRINNSLAREALAEFLGTFVMLSFGDGSVAQKVLSQGDLGSALSIHWSWGIGVIMGVFVAGGVSGAHLNPSITLTLAFLGRFPWRKVLVYWLAQYVGAFAAAACVYLVYYDALNNYDSGHRAVSGDLATAGLWATYPQTYVSSWNCLGDQVWGTAMLMLCILAISDPHNAQPSKAVSAISVGLLVVVIGMTFGLNCGYAINPARDLGPRIFSLIGGWGTETFSYRDYNYFWIPVIGPHIGALLGAAVYQLCVGLHWPREEAQEAPPDTDPHVQGHVGPYMSSNKL